MRAAFVRADGQGGAVGEAVFDGRTVTIATAADDEARATLQRIFRPSAVLVDDPALRSPGASGESLLQPGSLDWFRAAAAVRGAQEGLKARLIPDAWQGGWDPAAAYRTFRDDVGRRAAGD